MEYLWKNEGLKIKNAVIACAALNKSTTAICSVITNSSK